MSETTKPVTEESNFLSIFRLKAFKRIESNMKHLTRPTAQNSCLIENDAVYASYTLLNDTWAGGLFSKIDIQKGELLCEYVGKILTAKEATESTSEYLFSVRDPDDLRRKKVIDGDPNKSENIAAYANYSDNVNANAMFLDQTKRKGVCKIVLISKEFIPAGIEIRVDYDMGSSVNPFRDFMIQSGIYDSSVNYKETVWARPTT